MSPMQRALELARQAVGFSSPNPPVGAVLVRDGEMVGEGRTQPSGQAHAEIEALAMAGGRARGATIYVTLEPCNHQGRTGPCTEAIIAAGVVEVHASISDPSPNINGSGFDRLREAGIAVKVGESSDEAAELAEPHARYISTGLPLVTAKFAISLDGKIATQSGESRWISGVESRLYTHELRAASDAILAGIETVVVDDPQLSARDADGKALPRQPVRVIIDSRGRMPSDARVLSEPGTTLVAIATNDPRVHERLNELGVEALHLPGDDGRVDLAGLIKALGQREMTSVFIEGGGTVLGSMFDLGLIDKVVAFVAPMIIGGASAPGPVNGLGAERMADVLRLNRVKVLRFGDDVAVTGYARGGDLAAG
ncbi:MAG: bifunctional diaminohydroxyphosphoribosylaminopyrimidine deaminase/5-amino-6-(5-phosphoribosylamino)uracil reductase RibD [SAR202 cluster bacterium]|nr:bifunctional diaminohydroxyphosphoribosylaminopyrimidine deaminase/5-amino-6-(5-phosphoribosylamino)uracil reductase RibD [SAR202 cluster bacterium]